MAELIISKEITKKMAKIQQEYYEKHPEKRPEIPPESPVSVDAESTQQVEQDQVGSEEV